MLFQSTITTTTTTTNNNNHYNNTTIYKALRRFWNDTFKKQESRKFRTKGRKCG